MTASRAVRARLSLVPAVVATVALGAVAATSPAFAAAPQRPPNVIVIQADDQNLADMTPRVMPHTWSFLARRGTVFRHYVVATPQCCPSRASLLTGEYPHNNGVLSNGPGYAHLHKKDNTLPAWLQRRGYFTVHVGKYLNNYDEFAGSMAIPAPGWDRWFSVGGEGSSYYDYDVGVNGRSIHFGTQPGDYVTRAFERYALHEITLHAGGARPFYLQLDERAPHIATHGFHPAGICGHAHRPVPDPLDVNRFMHASLSTPPSFNEADVSDKPSLVQSLPPLTDAGIKRIRRRRRCRLATLRGVDRTVWRIRHELRDVHALGDTIVIYISDNGVFDGEHRIREGKALPYEETVRQPLLVRVPPTYLRARRPRRVDAEVANIDLAPTILDFAAAEPCIGPGRCRTMDGRSLVPLLRGRKPGWTRDRAILEEFDSPTPVNAVCAFRGLQLRSTAYTNYTSVAPPDTGTCSPDDERELYDLTTDPFELQNELFNPSPEAIAEADALQKRIHSLAQCSGIAGRDPAPPPGTHYCD